MGYCLLFGIARTIDLEGGLLIGIVRTIYLGDGLLIGMVRTNRFGDCPLIGIVRTIGYSETDCKLELSEQLTSGTFNQYRTCLDNRARWGSIKLNCLDSRA